jgi:hypothetical protein
MRYKCRGPQGTGMGKGLVSRGSFQKPGQSVGCAAVEPDGLSLEAPSNLWKSSGRRCADRSDYGQPRNSNRVGCRTDASSNA